MRIWNINPVCDGEMVRRVYARAWPQTCRDDVPTEDVIDRLSNRDLVWWQNKLNDTPVAIGAGPSQGGYGFALAVPEADGWELGYLFVEPETFGTGLAKTLHDEALGRLSGRTERVGCWILEGNTRSQRFFTRQGWTNRGIQTPPWDDIGRFYRYDITL